MSGTLIGRKVRGYDLLPFVRKDCRLCKGSGWEKVGVWCRASSCVIKNFLVKHRDDVMDVAGKQHWRLGREPKEVSSGSPQLTISV